MFLSSGSTSPRSFSSNPFTIETIQRANTVKELSSYSSTVEEFFDGASALNSMNTKKSPLARLLQIGDVSELGPRPVFLDGGTLLPLLAKGSCEKFMRLSSEFRKIPLAPLLQRGKRKTGIISNGGVKRFFPLVATSPFCKGGSRGILTMLQYGK